MGRNKKNNKSGGLNAAAQKERADADRGKGMAQSVTETRAAKIPLPIKPPVSPPEKIAKKAGGVSAVAAGSVTGTTEDQDLINSEEEPDSDDNVQTLQNSWKKILQSPEFLNWHVRIRQFFRSDFASEIKIFEQKISMRWDFGKYRRRSIRLYSTR